jgi:hypothetical protein
MWQTLIVVALVGAAGLWLARRFWRTFSGQGPACGCGGGGEAAPGCCESGDGGGQPPACACAGCPSLAGSEAAPGPAPACQGCVQASIDEAPGS